MTNLGKWLLGIIGGFLLLCLLLILFYNGKPAKVRDYPSPDGRYFVRLRETGGTDTLGSYRLEVFDKAIGDMPVFVSDWYSEGDPWEAHEPLDVLWHPQSRRFAYVVRHNDPGTMYDIGTFRLEQDGSNGSTKVVENGTHAPPWVRSELLRRIKDARNAEQRQEARARLSKWGFRQE